MKPIIQLTVSGLTADQATAISMVLQKMGGSEKEALAVTAPEKRTRRTKAEIEAANAEAEEDEIDEEANEEIDEEESEEDEIEDGEEDEEESEEEESDTIGESDLKKLKAALKSFSDKNGKAKAVKTLMKYAKTSAEVTKDDFPKLMKLLK